MPKLRKPRKTTCKDHTPCPDSYTQWHWWAEAMHDAGKRQVKCDECAHFSIWVDGRGIVRRKMFC